jgi:CUG-BP- and ETR3-like factor
LFIFHIPNHFTNLDMYQLFCPYGNLLSVRIMVEKDSGRSRGFGFVSYDNPDAAALAIKELNGFAIGNKRLKVQHKQIRPAEQQNQDMNYGAHGGGGHPQHHGGRGRGGRGGFSSRGGNNLPPSGSMTMPPTGWYSNNDLNNNPPGSPSATTGDVASSDSQHVVVVLGDGPSNSTNVAIAESAGASAAVSGQDEQKAKADPLSSMDPLRQSLPDRGDVATPAAPGED